MLPAKAIRNSRQTELTKKYSAKLAPKVRLWIAVILVITMLIHPHYWLISEFLIIFPCSPLPNSAL